MDQPHFEQPWDREDLSGSQMNEPEKAGLSLTSAPSVSSRPLLLFQVALETLLLRGPQKPQTHPLTDYRYTGELGQVPTWFLPG